ncbi:arsenic transporter [Consotaella salsifontis]|uniref:arsenic transporter n=1 Tax=Consotaella salsifontis TaxID=1365950 RepID=UPI0009992DD0|nr:arsenic transporter [Consotaella salsifontis]
MLSFLLFLATLVLVLWQPKGLGIGWTAMGGATLALIFGGVDLQDIGVVWHIVWDATFTFVGLVLISLVLEEAGCFHWAALHVARWGGGSGRRLFPLIILLGAIVSAVFANDGAAMLLTPLVLVILLSLDFEREAAFAFAIAIGFVADTASLPLIISNLVNIVIANYFGIGFGRYAGVMAVVNLASVAATLLVLWLYFRKVVDRRYDVSSLKRPRSAIRDPAIAGLALPLLAALILAFFLAPSFGIPVSVVTGSAALILVAVAGRWFGGRHAVVPLKTVIQRAPWQIVWFSVGMYVVVYGLGNAGLTERTAAVLTYLGGQGDVIATVGTGFAVAILASVMNNLPATLLSALAVKSAAVSEHTRELMIYASVIGNDLGPKFTPIGSLATLLWLHGLARKGRHIGWAQYCRIGLILTPPVLLVALLTLAFWVPVVARLH